MEDESTLKSLKMMVEAAKEETITDEAVEVNVEIQAVLEENEALVVTKEIQVVEVLDLEKNPILEAIEMLLQEKVLTDQEEKVVLIATALQEENQVQHKEKALRQDDLKAVTDQQDVRLMTLKPEDQEKANALKLQNNKFKFKNLAFYKNFDFKRNQSFFYLFYSQRNTN